MAASCTAWKTPESTLVFTLPTPAISSGCPTAKPTRQPVVLDLWQPFANGAGEVFTTVASWRQPRREVKFDGEAYQWSKHHQFLKVIDLPTLTTQRFELALAADRSYMLAGEGIVIALSALNRGALPGSSGLSRLAVRFLGEPQRLKAALDHDGPFGAEAAVRAGLVTFAPDDIDWQDEVRLAVEERAAMSPDALTGMEANLRFPGPETLETKIFGRLSAWQNWIFTRPNATGEKGALTTYGKTGQRPELDRRRT